MKVGTDGILLGAWVDLSYLHAVAAPHTLDIGTGTGLIALMLAQRLEHLASSAPLITALEIDEAAASQAAQNVSCSSWADQIEIQHGSIQKYPRTTSMRYDLIVSNPPYFTNSLPAPDHVRHIARHADTLPFNELCKAVCQLLKPTGRFSIIFPADQFSACQKIASNAGLNVYRCCWVKPTPALAAKRVLITFMHQTIDIPEKRAWNEETITLEHSRHQRTPEFQQLVQDFYLDK